MSKKGVTASEKRSYVPPRKYHKGGRPFKHGGYSLAIQDEVLKENPRVTKYIMDTRAGLVRDIAGSEDALSEQQRLMIDRIISKLAVCRLIELYVEKYGAFRKDKLQQGVLEIENCLGVNYLAFSNSIDRALQALGLSKIGAEKVIDLSEYAHKYDVEAPAGRPGVPQDERPAGCRGADEGRDEALEAPHLASQGLWGTLDGQTAADTMKETGGEDVTPGSTKDGMGERGDQ